jgi:hypothetical protein
MGKSLDERYPTREAVQAHIDAYFNDRLEADSDRRFKADDQPAFEDFAYHMGVTLQTLRNYEHERGKRADSHCTEPIKQAMQRITANYERILVSNGRHTGALFALKNRGWTDTQEIKQELRVNDLRGVFDRVQAGVTLQAVDGGKGKASNDG